MKIIYPKLLFFLLPLVNFAQLHVQKNDINGSANDVYIYNSGELLYVKQDISLKDGSAEETSGNIYLRNGGELIQGDDNATNSGTGIVSVFQEGTANQWDYHFWASPVGNPLTSGSAAEIAGNTQLSLSGRNTPSGRGGGLFTPTDVITSDPASYNPPPYYEGIPSDENNAVRIASYWLNKYTKNSGYYGWQNIRESGTLNPGEGFTMKGVGAAAKTTERYDFRGRPNNGTIKVAVGPQQTTLVGNPYPSAMDLNMYLMHNSGQQVINAPAVDAINGIAYFWESDPAVKSHYISDYLGGYGTYSAIDLNYGTYAPPTYSKYLGDGTSDGKADTDYSSSNSIDHYIPVGQAFFVVGTQDNFVEARNEFRAFAGKVSVSKFMEAEKREDLNFSATQQSKLKLEEEEPLQEMRIRTDVNDTYVRELVAVFYTGSTAGFDHAKDGENISFLGTDISYYLSDTDKPYNINVLPLNVNKEIPLTINAGGQRNTFAIQVSEMNFNTEGVWLWDKELNKFYDIKESSYELNLPEGKYTERFAVVFHDDAAMLDIAEEIKESFDVVQYNKLSQLQVLNPKRVAIKEITVFNILGKELLRKKDAGSESKVVLSSANWSDGIYIVRVVTEDNISFSKKIAVRN